ncbi:hypothetical protein ABRU26_000872 [Listeria monocytogenes]
MDESVFRTEFGTIHDCFATKIVETNNNIIFYFEDGFWISAFDIKDQFVGIFISKKSEVVLHDSKLMAIQLHNNDELVVTWESLVEHVNKKEWRLEFLSEEQVTELIFTCFLWYDTGKADFLTISFLCNRVERKYDQTDY